MVALLTEEEHNRSGRWRRNGQFLLTCEHETSCCVSPQRGGCACVKGGKEVWVGSVAGRIIAGWSRGVDDFTWEKRPAQVTRDKCLWGWTRGRMGAWTCDQVLAKTWDSLVSRSFASDAAAHWAPLWWKTRDGEWKEYGFWRQRWVQLQGLRVSSCVPLGFALNLLQPLLRPLKVGVMTLPSSGYRGYYTREQEQSFEHRVWYIS